jgi:S-formylglutathione hydrolase FrmB
MALIRLDHVPETVKVNLPLYIILPDPGKMGDVPVAKRKVLYLLHGLSDDGSAWQRYTSIETLAKAYGLVVVMPSVGRSFYINQPNGQNYFDYLVDELPRYLKDVFGLASKREDTLIAGLSMGGYGAFKAALLHPEMYSSAASFSGVLSMDIFGGEQHDPNDPHHAEFIQLFGDLTKLGGSEHDPAVWLKRGAAHPTNLPRLFIACGRQDDLYPLSIGFHKACQSLGVNSQYREEEGGHDWFFWDAQVRWFLEGILGPLTTKW